MGMVALCSKTYLAWGEKNKISHKGINKRLNEFTPEDYLEVLEEGIPKSEINKGFRYLDGKLIKYTQRKDGLSYVYPKRKVLDDGLSTAPLDL